MCELGPARFVGAVAAADHEYNATEELVTDQSDDSRQSVLTKRPKNYVQKIIIMRTHGLPELFGGR